MNSLTIALDVMGGDKGPHITINAAILAINKEPRLHLFLCGDKSIITKYLLEHHIREHPQLTIIPTTETVAMDEKPSSALRNKRDSSMRKALDLVEQGKAQACVSAGNTGALFAMAYCVLKTLPGVERPALISALPTHKENKNVFMLDLGANVFCEANILYQFGLMGSVIAEQVDGITKPRVALLNMGEEDIKGSDHIKLAATKLSANKYINYVGFIEGNDIFTNKTDVIVCDGFVGNVALKTCEGVAQLVYRKLDRFLSEHFFARIIGKMLAPALKKLFKSMNPDQYNGASLIGLRGIVVKSHGNASAKAFEAAIFEAIKEVEQQVPEKITIALEQGLIEETHTE
ncbi:phosphate acyltransferase PlsX [Thalassotalea piscium]|uniref:Phosphate acyltransferase n=1 Tax=Thalassotalea piscium TaxID=1230533 RepID=A0A7X0NES2_9GAMM|nr:phosphate acyltransferase PlsX [Thalassotalea piscium]MBB6542126.1 glycerol-3-phosphate acyltransferase PlsX [Thalassotalea piscium]